jgi:hypothetical protein
MKTCILRCVACALLFGGHPQILAQAGSSASSANHELLHAPPGTPAGGGAVSGGGDTISAEISVGAVFHGVPAEITTLGTQVKPNLIGQLYDPRTLAVSAMPATVDERDSRQLTATATLDDETTLAVAATEVVWSEDSEALAGISTAGLVTAASVYQDEPATVHGSHHGIADPDGFSLTVLNISSDDFGTYAADGIDDDWQVGWFGLPPNADAAPAADPDSDQQDNRFEFLSGFSPIDPLARFTLTVVAVDRGAETADLQLNRVIPDRIYTLMASPDLVTPFAAIGTLPAVEDPQTDVIIRDTSATAPRNFYRIGISKP